MANQIVRPNGQGHYDTWAIAAGLPPTKWQAITDGSDATRVKPTSNAYPDNVDTYTLGAYTVGSGEPLTAMTVNVRTRADNYNWTPRLRLAGVDEDGAIQAEIMTGVRRYVNKQQDVARPGGGTPTGADLATLQIGGQFDYGGSYDPEVVELWLDVEFDAAPGGGGFVAMLWSLVGPMLIGSSLTLHDVARMAEALARHHRVRLNRREVEQAWLELKAWRRPAFSFVRA